MPSQSVDQACAGTLHLPVLFHLATELLDGLDDVEDPRRRPGVTVRVAPPVGYDRYFSADFEMAVWVTQF